MLNHVLKILPHRPWRATGLSRAKPRARVPWGHFRDSEAENAPFSALSSVWGGPSDLLRWRRRRVWFISAVTGLAPRAVSRARFSGVVWDGQIRHAFSVISGRFVVKSRAPARSAPSLVINCASRASDTPWAAAAVHRGRDIKTPAPEIANNNLNG